MENMHFLIATEERDHWVDNLFIMLKEDEE
jgi:hypothetical protein